MVLRELEQLAESKAKSSSSSSSSSSSAIEDRDQVREQLLQSLPEVREQLLQSLHEQLSNFLCFTPEERVYNYEDPTARKTMQDALQLRFALVGGMFESITCNFQSIAEWALLLVQLIVRGVIDLTNNAEPLYCTVLDMLTALIHSTLVIEREAGGSDRAEENRRLYLQLVKRIKKEIGDKQSQSIKYLRQLLPFPKQFDEVWGSNSVADPG
jgi:mediator of RNA polymerase II transcription subunit 12